MPVTKRYSTRRKNNILKEIVAHNSAHGKGGIFHAHKKYGVAIKTLNNWLGKTKAREDDSQKKSGGGKKKVRAARRQRGAVRAVAAGRSFSGRFALSLKRIEKYERQIRTCEALIAKEKAALQGMLK